MGLLYHIYKELSPFSKFDAVISTDMKEESPIGLPSLTICINKEEILSKEKFEKIYDSTKSSAQDVTNFLNVMKIKEQNEFILKFREILNYFDILSSDTKIYRKCEEVTEIRNHISIDWKCFTLFSQLSHESNEVFEVDIERNVFLKYNLINMEFKPEFKNFFNVFFN